MVQQAVGEPVLVVHHGDRADSGGWVGVVRTQEEEGRVCVVREGCLASRVVHWARRVVAVVRWVRLVAWGVERIRQEVRVH